MCRCVWTYVTPAALLLIFFRTYPAVGSGRSRCPRPDEDLQRVWFVSASAVSQEVSPLWISGYRAQWSFLWCSSAGWISVVRELLSNVRRPIIGCLHSVDCIDNWVK